MNDISDEKSNSKDSSKVIQLNSGLTPSLTDSSDRSLKYNIPLSLIS
jgi:hypothetical protein